MKCSLIFLSVYLFSDHADARSLESDAENRLSEAKRKDNEKDVTVMLTTAKPVQAQTINEKSGAKEDPTDIIINLNLEETTTSRPNRRFGEQNFAKAHERDVLQNILNPQILRAHGEPPSMKLDVNLQSVLSVVNAFLSSRSLNYYADAIARKAAGAYKTFSKQSEKGIKPQIVEFRAGKPSLVYAFDADDILKSIDNFLASSHVRSYIDELARKAGSLLRPRN